MLVSRNGWFSHRGISFAIPNDFLFDSESEMTYENGISAWTPDERCHVDWWVEEYDEAPDEGLRDLFTPGSGMRLLEEMKPLSVNGLSGFQAIYQTRNEQIFETRLVTESKDGQIVIIVRDSENDIHSVLDSQTVREILKAVKAEQI